MLIKNYKKIVIKIGSTTIVNQLTGKLKTKWLHSICEDIAKIENLNKKIAIVSSGAIALGRKLFSNHNQIKRLEDKQAAAAIGQIELANHWQQAFKKYNIHFALELKKGKGVKYLNEVFDELDRFTKKKNISFDKAKSYKALFKQYKNKII